MKNSLAENAFEKIRDRIIEAEILPGQEISARKIAKELGMSFMPVREALVRLEQEGFVHVVERKTIVRYPDPHRFFEKLGKRLRLWEEWRDKIFATARERSFRLRVETEKEYGQTLRESK